MREKRLFITVLVISAFIVSLIGCSKTENEKENEEQQASASAAQSDAPAEHEVVSTVREFLKAIDSGDYDRAIGLGTPNEFKREGLVKINETFEFDKAEITEAYVGNENAAVLTNSIPASRGAVQFGFSLIKSDNHWLIRDVDMLPSDEAVKKWFAGFEGVEPTAKRVTE